MIPSSIKIDSYSNSNPSHTSIDQYITSLGIEYIDLHPSEADGWVNNSDQLVFRAKADLSTTLLLGLCRACAMLQPQEFEYMSKDVVVIRMLWS